MKKQVQVSISIMEYGMGSRNIWIPIQTHDSMTALEVDFETIKKQVGDLVCQWTKDYELMKTQETTTCKTQKCPISPVPSANTD